MTGTLTSQDLADFEPLAQRARSADADAFIRVRADGARVAGFVTLPFEVIAGRTIAIAGAELSGPASADNANAVLAHPGGAPVSSEPGALRVDATYATADFLDWMAGGAEPLRKDAHWLGPLPPRSGWQRIEKVPDSAIRDVVRRGAVLARDITAREEQRSLLSSMVLTATSAPTATAPAQSHQVPLRALTALTKMAFLPRGGQAAVDLAPGWLRVAAAYGSTYVATGSGLLRLSTG